METALSIIVPTLNEAGNVEPLVDRLTAVLGSRTFEILFIDDSTDNTPHLLARLAARDPRVRYVHRDDGRGLGSAIALGLEQASGDVLAVIDGDLQHPPEILLSMLEAVESGADIVVPTRFLPGGSDGGLDWFRKLVSTTARFLAWALLPSTRSITDPTSGLFMLRSAVVSGVQIEPSSWKVLLEILVKGHYCNLVQVPYRFQAREAGSSKMSVREQVKYMLHLVQLCQFKVQARPSLQSQ